MTKKYPSRKQFIQSHGADCRNWNWSWSFVNHAEKFVIFGAWDTHSTPERQEIMGENWRHNKDGEKNKAFPQALEHIKLVESAGYRLFTFPIIEDKKEEGPSMIGKFEQTLTQKSLRKIGKGWFAYDYHYDKDSPIPEEVAANAGFTEGSTKLVTVNAYERSREARDKCIAYYKPVCVICRTDFEKKYGSAAKGLIHVHHLVPLSEIKEEYTVDPIKDLRPVCPNCHAVIHYGGKTRSIEEVQGLWDQGGKQL